MTDWSQDDINMLIDLWAKGLSAGQISAHIGGKRFSRNAVIGKVHRMGLQRRAPSSKVWAVRGDDNRIRPTRKTNKTTGVVNLERAVLGSSVTGNGRMSWKAEPLPKEDPRPEKTITLDDLEPHHCRYIYGDVKASDYGYCGKHAIAGLPYCMDHVRRCYTPAHPSKSRFDLKDRTTPIKRYKVDA